MGRCSGGEADVRDLTFAKILSAALAEHGVVRSLGGTASLLRMTTQAMGHDVTMAGIGRTGMRNGFPIVVCIVGAIADFTLWAWLRRFRVREKAPPSLARFSIEERQRRVKIVARVMFASGWMFVAGAVLMFWLGNRN